MNALYSILKKLGLAILLGAGFGVGLVIIFIAWLFLGAKGISIPSSTNIPSSSISASAASPAQFKITNPSVIRTPPADKNAHYMYGPPWGAITFTGTIENTGPDSDRYLNVYADMFDKDGKFIFQCMTQFSEGLKHNEIQNFIIECHNWPEEIAGKYTSYKIYTKGN